MQGISLALIREELATLGVEAPQAAAGGKTAEEWSQFWGRNPTLTRRILRKCMEAGILVVSSELRQRIDQKAYLATLYSFRLADAPAKKGGARKPPTCPKPTRSKRRRPGGT